MATKKSKPKGKFVLIRASAAGVHAGVLVSRKGDEVELTEARRLWLWRVPAGKPDFLSGVAMHGLGEDCKIGCPINLTVLGACEVIACSAEAEASIRGYKAHAR